jgi:hypothetical protein
VLCITDDTAWICPAETICEGFDHPDAPPTDLEAAAQQLKLATMQEYQKRLAYKPSRKQSKKAAAAAAGSSSSSSSRAVTRSGSASSSSDSSWQERLQRLQSILDATGEEQL